MPSGDRIARSCRHKVPDLAVKTEVKDRIAKEFIIAVCFGLLGPFQTMIVCPEIKQKQAQDRKTHVETVLPPVAKILSPVCETGAKQGVILGHICCQYAG